MPAQPELIQHLFRTEYGKLVAVLTGIFGFDQIETAEDIAADAFVIAIETWGLRGLPESPTAWLYNVAKNIARNYLKNNAVFLRKVSVELRTTSSGVQEPALIFSDQKITDSQLRMIFAVCQPILSKEAQICLALRVLCGFGIEEIADAFLSNKEAINKRLYRAKGKLRSLNISLELPGLEQVNERLKTVLTVIYLLFNEGYYSVSEEIILRKDFCLEAIRLCHMLVKNTSTDLPSSNALLSLMCFHASRFEARINSSGGFVLYEDQDISLWNHELIEKGEYYLSRAATGDAISKYHLEAAIAYWHTQRTDTVEKWENVLKLYNQLLAIEYSPIADLNRIYALSKAKGKLDAIETIKTMPVMNNLYYFILMSELFIRVDDLRAKSYLRQALSLSKTEFDRSMIKNKISLLN